MVEENTLPEEILTTAEVCAFLRIERHTLARLVKEGKITAFTLSKGGRGASKLYRRSNIEEFVRKREEKQQL